MPNSEGSSGVSNRVIEAFHLMWDYFPQVVLLLKKERKIVVANRRALEFGFHPGKRCYEVVGQSEIHAGCRANIALDTGNGERSTTYDRTNGRVTDAYWLPVPGEKELYLHFTIYIDLAKRNPPSPTQTSSK